MSGVNKNGGWSGVNKNGGWSGGGICEDNGMMVELVVAMVRKWDGECDSDGEGYGSERWR